MSARLKFGVMLATFVVALSCTENLPTGPTTFNGTSLRIAESRDTIVIGDSVLAAAEATDASGNVIQGLSFSWASADPTIVALSTSTDADGAAGRTRYLVAKKTGTSAVTLTLTDARFASSPSTRNQTAVVGGVRILTTHDSTLTALNDTAVAIAAGLVRVNGTLTPRASQGIRWTKLGSRTTLVGSGDTVRYVANSNGVDTLIASHLFCLAGAKCADTLYARVNQQLSLTLSAKSFRAWSFGDTVGPVATLADRRGNGLAGTTVRLIPQTAADSALVRVTGPVGISNPATGLLSTPRLLATGNGTANVTVQAIGADGSSILASDVITATVRQVARRIAIDPLRATLSVVDSIPFKPVARDARGFIIADATMASSASGIAVHGIWAGPNGVGAIGTNGTITPSLSGAALPEANPTAPQVPYIVDQAVLSMVAVDTVRADNRAVVYTVVAFDSVSAAAGGTWVRFKATSGTVPDSVQLGSSGTASVTWTPSSAVGRYTLTGVRSSFALSTLADSTGRIVLRRTVEVINGTASASKSSAAVGATTVASSGTTTLTVRLLDAFGNPALDGTPTDFTVTASRGTVGAFTCTSGVCTATYTAPATAGADTISVQIGGVGVLLSPITMTIT